MKMLSLLLLILISSTSIATKIYSWVDENGVKHYSENEPEQITNKANYKEQDLVNSKTSTRLKKSNSKTISDDCKDVSEDQKKWDAATLSNIRGYYNTRTRQCRQFYKRGSYQIKNCFQEQKEIKAKKMKAHRKRLAKRCK